MNQIVLNKNNPESVDYMNNLALAVCIKGEDLNNYKSTLNSVDGLYEKCEKFVSIFHEMEKNNGNFSNVAIKKLHFQGKQVWLTEVTLSLLMDVLKGKDIVSMTFPSDDIQPKEVYIAHDKEHLSLADLPQDKSLKRETAIFDRLLNFLRGSKDWLMSFDFGIIKNIMGRVWFFLWNHKKWAFGIAAVIVVLIVLLSGAMSLDSNNISKETQLQDAIGKINFSAELGTVEYKVKLAHVEKDPNVVGDIINNMTSTIFGRNAVGERALVIVSMATLKAGVDLRGFSMNNVQADGSSIVVTLPKPIVFSQNIDLVGTECYLYSGSMRNEYTLLETSRAKQYAEEDLLNYVSKCRIIDDAQKNAEDFMTALLKQLGYTSIIIKFN